MSHIFLTRHGETVWHSGNRYAGRSDVALTDFGVAQAEQLGRWAEREKLSGIWSSPLSRAQCTASPASRLTGLPVYIDERLVELNFGRGEGLTDAEMEQEFPAERAAFKVDPVAHYLPGGEDPVLAAQRGVAALREIAKDAGPDGRILVVTHNTLSRLMVCEILGAPLRRYRSVLPALGNCSLTELRVSLDSIALLSFNIPLPK